MGLLKKKKSSQPAQPDALSIDAAMDELSKQTEALLSDFGEQAKVPKPALPKKSAKFAPKGKSFDVFHDPRKKTQLKSTLKASEPTSPEEGTGAAIELPETPLLEEHATDSYNEIGISDQKPEDSEQPAVDSPAVIVGHEAKLTVATDNQSGSIMPGETAASLEAQEDVAVELVAPISLESQEPLSFNEEPAEGESQVAEDEPVKEPVVEVSEDDQAQVAPEAETDAPPKAAADDIYVSGELHANNLVKNVKPKGYQALEDTGAPAVFDTEEYHPELHDWSKLEHKNGPKWILLVLLVIVAGGLGYFVISGQKFPF